MRLMSFPSYRLLTRTHNFNFFSNRQEYFLDYGGDRWWYPIRGKIYSVIKLVFVLFDCILYLVAYADVTLKFTNFLLNFLGCGLMLGKKFIPSPMNSPNSKGGLVFSHRLCDFIYWIWLIYKCSSNYPKYSIECYQDLKFG